MKHYTVATIQITDGRWVSDYAAAVTSMVDSAGGRYLARTSRTLHLEGDAPGQLVHLLIEWPSPEAAMEFYESAEYAPYRQQRQAGSHGDMWLVPGEDAAGIATLPSASGGVH